MIKTNEDLSQIIAKSKETFKEEGLQLIVCAGTGCVASGSLDIYTELEKRIKQIELPIKVELLEEEKSNITAKKSGCHGFCEKGPLVKIEPLGILYTKVQLTDVADIIASLLKGYLLDKLVYQDSQNKKYPYEKEIPFYAKQQRLALKNCGNIDPEKITDYLAKDGYKALSKALLEMTAAQVCQEVINSNLRGRGGGGFPTGLKWEFARKEKADQKYVIVNGDEGDPGAFMDRSMMEGDPHGIIEGIMIAGYATGANKGYLYVRAEYPLAVARLRKAIKEAYQYGLLGNNILATDFNFDLEIKEGAGAFVCGEETALMASIEGERGMPKPKPPFPAQSGLWGKPTTINNVETLANITEIIIKGADKFKEKGMEKSPGTKTFAITGDVANTGLVEVPMGISLKEVLYDIGGGIRDGKGFKAVQIGGPSGGCLIDEHLDLPLDFDSLQKVGAMIGSGGLVVMDDATCMVEVARFFMEFTQNESCGKCVLCREGTKQMLKILEKIIDAKGKPEDLDLLKEVALAVKEGSLCGLGKTAPNPVLTTLKFFYNEYEAHVTHDQCPAGVCEAFKGYTIDSNLCKGCSLCKKKCPVEAISGKIKEPFVIDQEKCIKCGACVDVCKFNAVEVG